jgi:hypothetical protein
VYHPRLIMLLKQPAGCIVALSGIDKVVSKTATIIDADRRTDMVYPIRPVSARCALRCDTCLTSLHQMKFTVAPIVAYSVKVRT